MSDTETAEVELLAESSANLSTRALPSWTHMLAHLNGLSAVAASALARKSRKVSFETARDGDGE